MSHFNNGSGAEIIEENNYYPFGLKHEGYNALVGNPSYQYKYNEKELQQETGWSDYGWRQYMPEIGKWNGMDQLSEKYYSTSPFAYVANNPISGFDVDGRMFNDDGTIDTSGTANGFVRNRSFRTQDFGERPGEGGGGGINGGLNFTGSAFGFLVDFFINDGNSVNSLFSMVDQLKSVWKDPMNDKATFGDAAKMLNINVFKDLNSVLNLLANQDPSSKVYFVETTRRDIVGKSEGYKMLLNMSKISSVLELSYVIGHEMNHSITSYFSTTFYNTVGSRGRIANNAFGYFSEYISYSWEEAWGNTSISPSAKDYTYRVHGPNARNIDARYPQESIDLVNNNLNKLLRAYSQFIKPK